MIDWTAIAEAIGKAGGKRVDPGTPRAVGGGCINETYHLNDGDQGYFVKLNGPDQLTMFEAEAAGLQEMAGTQTIRVPRPLCTGTTGARSYLVMEYIPLGGHKADGAAEAGRRLAAMHRASRAHFGWDRDNTIGSTPQPNHSEPDWLRFWSRHRLGFQLDLATRNGYGPQVRDQGERLLAALPHLIDHHPVPSLLHGDLWGGNLGFDQDGQPVIFDPAVYYGDREADLAMTELFGGFGGDFYAAYTEAWPLDPEYQTRKDLYNLYHILNHLNLFGTGYLGRAQGLMQRLLAHTR